MSEIDFPTLPTSPAALLTALGLKDPAKRREAGRIEQTAKDFESVFLHKLLEEMQRSVPKSGLLDSGATEQVEGLFWHYMSQHLADNGGLGLWKDIRRQMADTYAGAAAPADRPIVETAS